MAGHGRYEGLEVATTVVDDGAGGTREVRYLRRRPPPRAATPLARHRVGSDDRLDLITARYLGDPTAWWRVADANPCLDPDELVAAEGDVLIVPVPEV
jgi:hypothetical protein